MGKFSLFKFLPVTSTGMALPLARPLPTGRSDIFSLSVFAENNVSFCLSLSSHPTAKKYEVLENWKKLSAAKSIRINLVDH
jgi:hypothetical protein